MQKIKLRTEESGKKLSAAYAPPKWSETAEEEDYIYLYLLIMFKSCTYFDIDNCNQLYAIIYTAHTYK